LNTLVQVQRRLCLRNLFSAQWTILFFSLFILISCGGKTSLPISHATPEGSFRFVAWADTRTGTSILTKESIIANGLNPAFTIYPGDLINCNSLTNPGCFIDGFSAWKRAFNGGGTNNLFDKSFFTRGNHDANSDTPWEGNFDFAATAARIGAVNYSAQTKNLTYSFDYGNSHFVGLDAPGGDVDTITEEQIAWLDDDLTAAEGRGLMHAFLFWHGPIYYVDDHISTAPAALITALNKHSIVSAAFFGHEHLVAYTHIDSSRISDVTHPFEEFISGAAGAELYKAAADRYDYCLNDESGNSKDGFIAVDILDNHFTVTIYTIDGSIDNILSFEKGGGTLTPIDIPADIHR
jgi:hypothetical protein